MAKKQPKRTSGLIGLYGHTYVPDDELPSGKAIQYQFQIIRRLPPDKWLVQLFSYMDGRPTQVQVYTEAFLLGDNVKLYELEDEWNYQNELQQHRVQRSALKVVQ